MPASARSGRDERSGQWDSKQTSRGPRSERSERAGPSRRGSNPTMPVHFLRRRVPRAPEARCGNPPPQKRGEKGRTTRSLRSLASGVSRRATPRGSSELALTANRAPTARGCSSEVALTVNRSASIGRQAPQTWSFGMRSSNGWSSSHSARFTSCSAAASNSCAPFSRVASVWSPRTPLSVLSMAS